MSNDPNQQDPDQGKHLRKTSNPSDGINEADLWDLDKMGSQKEAGQGTSDSLPKRRTGGGSVLPKKPTETGPARPYVSAVKKPATAGKPTESTGETEAIPPVGSTPAGEVEPVVEPVEPVEPEAAQPFFASLNKTEKIAITALFAALVLAGTLAVIHFSNRVPTRPAVSEETDFPVSGKLIEVDSAVTYWRKPDTTGDNPDIVRRGTALIPVVRLALRSKPGAIRVFFRDEEGVVIGDGISRNVSGEQEMVIAATAGFDDIGMHAAYRTGEKEPWVVQIFEGPSSSADREQFTKVLETSVSTDVR